MVYLWFLQIQTCEKMGALFKFQIIDYALYIDYDVWFMLKVVDKILLMAGVSFVKMFSAVDNNISILNLKIVFDQQRNL